jgi:hypothetical protein
MLVHRFKIPLLNLIVSMGSFLITSHACAEMPKNPTRDQIIASCVIEKVSVQERLALQQSKTKMDAAELLKSMYQERLDEVKRVGAKLSSYEYLKRAAEDGFAMKRYEAEVEWVNTHGPLYRDALEEINALIITLKATPPTRKKR